MKKDLQNQFKIVIGWFNNNEISLSQLHSILLELNPYSKDRKDIEHGWYIEWVNENIQGITRGEVYRLSLTSSGGMYQSFEN